MNFYKHFLGDYARDTGDLSLTEHGAFRLMLDHFYGTSRPLPENKKVLYRLLRAENDADKKAVDAVSLRFWRRVPEELESLYEFLNLKTEEECLSLRTVATEWTEATGLINLRALSEIVKAQIIAKKNQQTAIQREQKKRMHSMKGESFSC